MMKIILKSQLNRNASAYVNDIVIMSLKDTDHITDLRETFSNLRKYRLKLNLEKMHLRCMKGKTTGMYGLQARHSSKPRKNQGNTKNASSKV